ncbi:YceI family protein [Aquimarina litoralis]|uniref:YceI family protein n=1 Tax=Aquimarina litoralis TaxID=584605 RepID=UPI001C57D6E2|nr:YceI family protein [Aquimarina litoralis]MBW1296484.1 YceI family protein [Aquimarina litoralis]
MKIKLIIIALLFSTVSIGQGKFLTKKGYTSFFSSTPIEDINADNNQVLSIIDSSSGTIAIAILMKSFAFEKSLMQEHFNENYVESDRYPKATFKGKIIDFGKLAKEEATVTIVGDLTIHGVTKKIETQSKIQYTNDKILLKGDFEVKVADFGIKIPSVVTNNIAKTIKVTFDYDHKPYTK